VTRAGNLLLKREKKDEIIRDLLEIIAHSFAKTAQKTLGVIGIRTTAVKMTSQSV
jgi:hypothetical protein